MNTNNSPLNHKLAAILSLSVSFLMTFFMFARFFVDEHPPRRFENQPYDFEVLYQPSIYHLIIFFLGSLLTFYLLYETCFWVFRKKIKNLKKIFVAFFIILAIASMMCVIFMNITFQFSHIFPDDFQLHLLHIYHNHIVHLGLVFSLIVLLTTLYISSFIRNQQTLLENQRLIAENIRNRHEALKNQLNPHFLFNSLNTLDGLIGFDDEKAHNYLNNLSSMFRYTIQNKEITVLKDELNFIEAYAYLMKIRFGDNLSIQYAIDAKYHHYHITPLSLQLLIENAIKHNVVSGRHPLTIRIETTENDTIKVSNAIQPKLNSEAGEGIGLANLAERYRLLFGMEVLITKNGNFSVEIPLVEHIPIGKFL